MGGGSMSEASPVATGFAVSEFSVGRTLQRATGVLLRNFLSFVSLSAIALLPLFLYLWYMLMRPSASAAAISIVIMILMIMALGSICQAIILYGAFQDLRGRPVNAPASLRKGLARALPLLGLSVMNGVATLIGFLLLVVPGLVVMSILFASIPACVVEGRGPIKSWLRSAHLTKGYRWRLFGLALCLWVLSQLVSKFLGYVALEAGGIFVSVAVICFWQALFAAYQATVVAVAYYELRLVKEGVDLNYIAAVFD
jgi:hypothetical protein